MCLIIWNPKGRKLAHESLIAASENNSDGWGVMFPENGRIRTIHSMEGVGALIKLTERLRGVPHSIHFRFRTRGEVDVKQCHPFEVLNKEEHGMDLWMMHNGTFSGVAVDDTNSDSKIFAGMLRTQILEMSKEIPNVEFRKVLKTFSDIIGTGNKLMFMSSGMDAVLVNQSRGSWIGGVWFSNTYSLSRPAWKRQTNWSWTTPGKKSAEASAKVFKKAAMTVMAPGAEHRRPLPPKLVAPKTATLVNNGYRRKVLTRISPNGKQVQVITYVKN